jgi:hypothetical protein
MALPVLDKTWFDDLNIELRTLGFGNAQQDQRELMWQIKNALVNLPVPWTVEYSCDGVTAGTPGDNIDRWTDRSDVSFGNAGVDGTSGVSWIVLKQSSILANFQLMIKCDSEWSLQATDAEITVSPAAGYTGGTTSDASPPTATDQVVVLTEGAEWSYQSAGASTVYDYSMNVWQSSDGQCNRIFFRNLTNGSEFLQIRFEVPKNPIPEWTNPFIAMWLRDTGNAFDFGSNNDAANLKAYTPTGGGGTMTFYSSCEGIVSAMNPQFTTGKNDLSGDYEFYPMGLHSRTLNSVGRHGEVFDLWYVPTLMVGGMTVPLTPSETKEFQVFGDMLIVNDGTSPVLV